MLSLSRNQQGLGILQNISHDVNRGVLLSSLLCSSARRAQLFRTQRFHIVQIFAVPEARWLVRRVWA